VDFEIIGEITGIETIATVERCMRVRGCVGVTATVAGGS
jgi:hypothetical protein